MKIALAALFAATVATTTGSAFAQDLAPQSAELVPAGVPLRVELDKSYPLRVGTRIQGHLTEAVYLIDHVAIPADSRVYGVITSKHSVSRQVRTAAMFNGDLTPLKNADVTFSDLETPDGRHFNIDTDATERTSKVVRMAAPEQAPRRSLGQRIAAAFRWTKRETAAGFTAPHKWDAAKQTLFAQVPVHPQELWAGTQYDAELKQPLELTGQNIPAPVEAADLNDRHGRDAGRGSADPTSLRKRPINHAGSGRDGSGSERCARKVVTARRHAPDWQRGRGQACRHVRT
jgi:hypothetical protein